MRFRGYCLVCGWLSALTQPVFAGYAVLRHVKLTHPEAFGLVGTVIEELLKT